MHRGAHGQLQHCHMRSTGVQVRSPQLAAQCRAASRAGSVSRLVTATGPGSPAGSRGPARRGARRAPQAAAEVVDAAGELVRVPLARAVGRAALHLAPPDRQQVRLAPPLVLPLAHQARVDPPARPGRLARPAGALCAAPPQSPRAPATPPLAPGRRCGAVGPGNAACLGTPHSPVAWPPEHAGHGREPAAPRPRASGGAFLLFLRRLASAHQWERCLACPARARTSRTRASRGRPAAARAPSAGAPAGRPRGCRRPPGAASRAPSAPAPPPR